MKNEPKATESKPIQFPEDYRSDPPSVPVGIFIQEAMDLCTWCIVDKEALVHAGLDWSVVEQIPLRAEVLSGIQSDWVEIRDMPNKLRKELRVVLPEAVNLRKELIHSFRHAFYNNPRQLSILKRIAKGATNASIVMSLYTLGILGRKQQSLLEKINMDLGMLEKAQEKSNALSGLIASVNSSKYALEKKQILRNQAFWHLKVAVDEVRRVGQFVYWQDKDKLKGYISIYKKKKKQRLKKSMPDTKK